MIYLDTNFLDLYIPEFLVYIDYFKEWITLIYFHGSINLYMLELEKKVSFHHFHFRTL